MASKRNFYMIPLSQEYDETIDGFETILPLPQEQISQINEQLCENLKSSAYSSPYDQIIIHYANPMVRGSKRIQFMFICTLSPISHPLFLQCKEANLKFKFARYYDFGSVYDSTPGMRFNNQFRGDFVEKIRSLA